jgi:hypothetical protein
MRYIGITGHRGSGKTSVAYLLGNMLDLLKYGRTKEQLRSYYWEWCETIENSQNAIYDCALNYVYFDEFGEMPKSFVAQLLGIDMAVLDNDTLKDNMYVSMKDFKLCPNSDTLKIITAEDILTSTGKKWSNCYISLREFTKCLSIDIMQKFFGSDVWLKTLKVNDEKWTEPEVGWRLFSDVKTKDEIQYIRDKQGVLIRTKYPSNKKSKKGITNIDSCDADYIIDTSGKLIDLFDSIYEIAEKIYNNERVF